MAGKGMELREPIHRHRIRVLYGDTDSGGVVYYGTYLRYFEAGRTEFMREQGISYARLEKEGLILPVVECFSRYKASARYDDLLLLETSLVEVRPVSCRFTYRLSRDGAGELLTLGYTTHAVVDRTGRLTRLPKPLLARLQELVAV